MAPSTDSDRCRLAQQITRHGAMQGDELRASLGWQIGQFQDAVYGDTDRWFEMTLAGWNLTRLGREGLSDSLGLHPRQLS